jgi:hypothetical protein
MPCGWGMMLKTVNLRSSKCSSGEVSQLKATVGKNLENLLKELKMVRFFVKIKMSSK